MKYTIKLELSRRRFRKPIEIQSRRAHLHRSRITEIIFKTRQTPTDVILDSYDSNSGIQKLQMLF